MEPLVSTAWLAEHLADPQLRLFEVTGRLNRDLVNGARERCYDEGHLPGAAFLDIASPYGDLSEPHAAFPWTWPSAETMRAHLARLGVGPEDHVVVYARTPRPGVDNGTMWCTRAWWLLHHAGVPVAILAGGFERWVAEGRPTSTEPVTFPEATPRPIPAEFHRGMATKDDVRAAIADGHSCVIDALAEASYRGEQSFGVRPGHIAGATNLPAGVLTDGSDTASFRTEAELRRHVRAAGAWDAARVVTYCGGGIAATVDAFVLRMLGHPDVAVYDNSLNEWAADPTLPMSLG